MTMPKGWKQPPKQNELPTLNSTVVNPLLPSQPLRPMICFDAIKISLYAMELLGVFDLQTGNAGILKYPNEKSILKYLEIRPVELRSCVLFHDGKTTDVQFPAVTMSDLVDIRTAGFFNRLENAILEIIFVGKRNQQCLIRLAVNDRYVHEIVATIQMLKRIESDANYWTRVPISYLDSNAQTRIVDIYPNTPFLAEGEDIVWQNMQKNPSDNKVVWLDALTNYRVFQYDYDKHIGSVILLPMLEEVRVVNEMRTPTITVIGSYLQPSYYLGNSDSEKQFNTLGDIIFTSKSEQSISFRKISDPQKLGSVTKVLKNRQAIQIGITKANNEPKVQFGSDSIIKPSTNNSNCERCGNQNPSKSVYCNKCGFKLQPNCAKCSHVNPAGSKFCAQCGSNLQFTDSTTNESINKAEDISIIESDFIECVIPKDHFKINYPASWLRIDGKFIGPPVVVGFMSPRETPSDPFLESFNIATEDVPDLTLQYFVDSNIAGKKQANPSFSLIESMSTTLGGLPAHQIIFTEDGLKSLCVMAMRNRRSYYLIYQAQPEKYVKFLAIAEQMISSFQFLA